MAQSVKVYSTTTCPYCIMVKSFLEDNNIPYTNLDVGIDRNALIEMKNKSGQLGVPVIDVDGTVIVGFDKEALAKALGLKAAV